MRLNPLLVAVAETKISGGPTDVVKLTRCVVAAALQVARETALLVTLILDFADLIWLRNRGDFLTPGGSGELAVKALEIGSMTSYVNLRSSMCSATGAGGWDPFCRIKRESWATGPDK